MPRKIYIASSWRNQHQNSVVLACRSLGHEVYDFKNPKEGEPGFSWSHIDINWKDWTPTDYMRILDHEIVNRGYLNDQQGLDWCDTCILLLPCGRSAHLEAGWCIGANKPTAVFISNEKFEPDLMYLMASLITDRIEGIYSWLGGLK